MNVRFIKLKNFQPLNHFKHWRQKCFKIIKSVEDGSFLQSLSCLLQVAMMKKEKASYFVTPVTTEFGVQFMKSRLDFLDRKSLYLVVKEGINNK